MKINNRETRRKNKSLFAHQVKKGRWGDWREYKIDYQQMINRGFTLTGLKRFVSNDLYSVQFYEHSCQLCSQWVKIHHLVIRRHDEGKTIPWASKQRIKNELAGEDATAIEIFPSVENLVDEANVFHLWVLPKSFELPFGLHFSGWSK